mmetsp:Transcript_8439/g.11372  ORF Transcript_8439/g.11372 Transcript_8439/m.11372 type:complete len:112 (+) Transcript_8439:1845-2180(+)
MVVDKRDTAPDPPPLPCARGGFPRGSPSFFLGGVLLTFGVAEDELSLEPFLGAPSCRKELVAFVCFLPSIVSETALDFLVAIRRPSSVADRVKPGTALVGLFFTPPTEEVR